MSMIRGRFTLGSGGVANERVTREELHRSLRNPHPEGAQLADAGLAVWADTLPADDADLVEANAGTSLRWEPDAGWTEGAS